MPYAPPTNYYKSTGGGIGRILKGFGKPALWKEMPWRIRENVERYDAAIAYIDYKIGELIETLETVGIFDQTFIILTSDHGESLTEHQIYFLHHCLYDVTIHVPLIFRCPDYLPTNKNVNGFVQHFDIVPAILDLLNIKYENLDGKSLIPLISGDTDQLHPAVYAEEAYYQRKRAIRTRDYKYIRALSEEDAFCTTCHRVHGGFEELYDLDVDPEENTNVVDTRRDVANSLNEKLSQWINSLKDTS